MTAAEAATTKAKAANPGKQKLKGKKGGLKKLSKKDILVFSIDCTHPVEDGIMNCADFEKYLLERIKVTCCQPFVETGFFLCDNFIFVYLQMADTLTVGLCVLCCQTGFQGIFFTGQKDGSLYILSLV